MSYLGESRAATNQPVVDQRPAESNWSHRSTVLRDLNTHLHGRTLLLAAAIVYLAYALFVTWPLATNISGLLSAPNFAEDGAATTWQFAYWASHHIIPFLPAHISALNAPAGVNQQWALNLSQVPSDLLDWVLSLVFGGVAGGNLFTLLGFVASGTTMFAFVQRLFGSRVVSLLAGFSFAFYPFPVAAASVHYLFVHGWPMVLCVWALLEMAHQPSRRSATLAGFATAFAMSWQPYYELLAGFALATMIVVTVGLGLARGKPREAVRAAVIALLPVAALGLFFALVLRISGGLTSVGTLPRPIDQVYAFSASLRDYLPGPYNPLFGQITGPYLKAHLGFSDFWDSAVYPGYVVVILALVGFVGVVTRVRANKSEPSDIRTVATMSAGILAVVAFVSSATPTVSVLGFQLKMPSWFIFEITPTWQTFSRFVILLELALVILMAAALAHLRQSMKVNKIGPVFLLVWGLLALDLWAQPPHHTVSTRPAPVYVWLRAHPGGIVADYPILPAYDPASAAALFWSGYDSHPLFQGYWALTSSESLKLDLADLAGSQTASKLASYGVRYIVVHRGTPGGSAMQLRAQGYRPVLLNRRGGSLWEVASTPARTAVDAASGFDWQSGYPTYDRRLLLGHGILVARARDCTTCKGTVSFFAADVARNTVLTVTDEHTGAVLARRELAGARQVRVVAKGVTLSDDKGRLELQTRPNAEVVVGLRSARLSLAHR